MASNAAKIVSGDQKDLPIELLHPNPYQPRRKFRKAGLVELGNSMKSVGLMQPVLVIHHPERDGEYMIVSGERRWRAAQMIGWGDVTCIVNESKLTPIQLAQLALIENEIREGLTPIEVALQFDRFRRPVEEGGFGMSVSAIARLATSYHRTTIQNSLALLTLPEAVQDMVDDGFLSLSMAKIIVGLPENYQIQMARAAIKGGWNVRQLANKTSHLTGMHGKRKRAIASGKKDPEMMAVQKVEQIGAEVYGTTLVIKKHGKGNWDLTVKASSLEQFNGILEKMGILADIDPYETEASPQ